MFDGSHIHDGCSRPPAASRSAPPPPASIRQRASNAPHHIHQSAKNPKVVAKVPVYLCVVLIGLACLRATVAPRPARLSCQHHMRRSVAGWVFVPVACLAALICTLYLRSDFGNIDSTALFHESFHASKAEALLKTLHSDVKQIVHSDHALHAMAAASIPHSALPIIADQRNSVVPFEAARMPGEIGSLGPRKNRPGVAQHFVQLARQWVARIEPLQHRLAPLQNELAFLDHSVALVKQRLSEAESQRDAVQAVIKSSRDSVEHAQRLLENAPAEKIALQRKMAHVANQISATSGTNLH